MFSNNKRIHAIKLVITLAEQAGLPQKDLSFAEGFLEYYEFGLALDQITEQLFEFEIKINRELYDAIINAGKLMDIEEPAFHFLRGLLS